MISLYSRGGILASHCCPKAPMSTVQGAKAAAAALARAWSETGCPVMPLPKRNQKNWALLSTSLHSRLILGSKMTRLSSNDIPPEIWLKIASYMHMTDIHRAETLNRTFAALVAEDQKERRSRLILNTHLSYHVPQYMQSTGDWKNIAYSIATTLQKCMYVAVFIHRDSRSDDCQQ